MEKEMTCLDVEKTVKEIGRIQEIFSYFELLGSREKRILEERIGIEIFPPKTLEEVGQIFNVTRERIRQIESKAFYKLTSALLKDRKTKIQP